MTDRISKISAFLSSLLFAFALSIDCDRLPVQQESLEDIAGQTVAVPCQGIQIFEPANGKTLELGLQKEKHIRFRLMPAACTDTVKFSSGNPLVAVVYPSGRVRGLSCGTTDIILECGDCQAKVPVRVVEKKVTGISFAQTERKMSLGHSYAIAYEVFPHQEYANLLKWTLPAPEDMEVRLDGPVMHIRPIVTGRFQIRATYRELAATLDMEVIEPEAGIGQVMYFTDDYPSGNVCSSGEWLFYDQLHARHGYDVPVLEFSLCDGSAVDPERLRVESSLPGTLSLKIGKQKGGPENVALITLHGTPEADRPEVSVYYDGKLIVYFTVVVNIPVITG